MAKKTTETKVVSKALVNKRLVVLLQDAGKAPSDSALAILHPWGRRKTGEPVSETLVRADDSGNHYIEIEVISIDSAPIEELSKLVTDIVNKEGLPKWMLQAGRRIEVEISESGPCTDSECWQLYGENDEDEWG